jgi:hypothetical protein
LHWKKWLEQDFSFGHTIEEGIADIEQSTLGDNHKTLIIAISEILKSSMDCSCR